MRAFNIEKLLFVRSCFIFYFLPGKVLHYLLCQAKMNVEHFYVQSIRHKLNSKDASVVELYQSVDNIA